MERPDGDRYVPDVERFPASKVNVPDPHRVPHSTATRVWIGIAWVVGILTLLGISFLVLIVVTAPRP